MRKWRLSSSDEVTSERWCGGNRKDWHIGSITTERGIRIMEFSDSYVEDSQDEFYERSNCHNLLKDGSMQLAGLVQECVEVYAFYRSSDTKPVRIDGAGCRKRKLDQNRIAISAKEELVDLTTTVVHLKLILRKWEDLMTRALERDYTFRLKVLSLSVLLLKFISEARKGFLNEITKLLVNEVPGVNQDDVQVNVCFITMNHLKLMTRVFCCGLNQARVEINGRDVPLILNLFMDALDLVLHGVGQNIIIDVSVMRDWLFLLTIPWLRKLGDVLPSCQCVPGLNFLCSANIIFDAKMKQRCVALLRFDGFYPFRNVIRIILIDIVITEEPDDTSVGVLELFSGFWWPLHLFSWIQLLKYYVYLMSQNLKRHDKEYILVLTEVVVRLPCAYAYKRISSGFLPHNMPVPAGCVICNNVFRDRLCKTKYVTSSKMPKFKNTDERILQSILLKLLYIRSSRVHFKLINVLHTLRKHAKLNLLQFTSVFWKIFSCTNSAVQTKLVDIYGYCTREIKRVVPQNPKRLNFVGNSSLDNEKNSRRKHSKGSKPEMKKKKRLQKDTCPSENRSFSNPKGQAFRKSTKNSTNRVSSSLEYTHPKTQIHSGSKRMQTEGCRVSGSKSRVVFPFSSQKDILTESKSAFVCKPPPGRFDAAAILYSNFLYKFYLSSGKSSIDELNWINLVDFHTCFMNWARHADGDIWVAEILKICLRMLANLDIVNVIILSQRILMSLAMRANCLPWELCARYKEVFAHEMKVICTDSFFQESDGRTDQHAIQLCTRYFLRVSFALDLSRKVMMNTFLRLMVKHCVVNMFHDQRDHTLVAAVCDFAGKSREEFLEEEFAYYYPNALLNFTPEQVETLLEKLRQVYTFDPVRVIKLNSQFLHIELVSHIFEYREKVLQGYTYLLEWNDERRNTASKKMLHRSIGDALEKLYMGVFLYFDAKFRTKAESILSKRRYLGCFAMLISLLGKKRVTSSKLKLYSMLNSLRTLGPDYNDLLFQAWKQFIVNLEDSSLRSMISQISASMTFLRKTNGTEVDGILKQVIINHGPVLQDNFRTLHFLVNQSGDPDVREKLKNVLTKISPLEFFYQLVEEVGSENSHVRYRAVQRLKLVLDKQMNHITDLKFDGHLFTGSTTNLLKNLLQASKEAKTEKMKILCASCIGMIGALDPRRFDLKAQLTANSRFGLTIFTVGEADFVIYFIGELTKVLRSSVDTRHFDACALCIQEVIRMYRITQSESDQIWSRLTPKAQDLLVPLFNSKYSKSENTESDSEMPRPIYLSKLGVNLKQWMYHWSMQMISVIESESIYNFFNTAMTIVEKSDRIGLVLLPYIASYSLMEGKHDGLDIFLQEVKAVLSNWVANETIYDEYNTSPLDATACPPGSRNSKTAKKEQTLNDHCTQSSHSVDKECKTFSYSAAQAVFKVLDHLTRLVRNPRLPQKKIDPMLVSQSQIAERNAADRNHTREAAEPIVVAQQKLRYDVVSKAAFACRNFARALMYMEQHLNQKDDDLDRCFGDLQRIYVALFDEDSLKGLESQRKTEMTVMEEVLNKLAQGKLEPCMPLFETIVGEIPDDLLAHQQLIHAYLGLSQFDVGGLLIAGCCSKKTEWKRSFDEASLEISIFQNDPSNLITRIQELSSEKLSSWGLAVSKAFLHFNSGDMDACKIAVHKSGLSLISEVGSGAAWLDMGFYFRHYQDFIRLQLLTELEETASLVALKSEISSEKLKKNLELMKASWDRRIRCAYKSTEVLRPIISFRKSLLQMAKKEFQGYPELLSALNTGIRDCFVKLVKLETGLGNFARANQLFLELQLKTSSSIYYEEAKMLLEAGKNDQCLKVLEVGMKKFSENQLSQFRKSAASANISEEQIRFAKGCLLFAHQMDVQKKVDLNRNIAHYKYAIDMNKRSEKNYFFMACYYDTLLSQADQSSADLSCLHLLTVQNFGSSLVYGCKYIYQSLPRLLRFWFDYASQNPNSRNMCPETVQKLTDSINNLLENAPTYIFIVAFSQLISRLAHVNTVVYGQLKKILAHMIAIHPDQVLWMIVSVLKSTYPKRVMRCNEILKLAEQQVPALKSVIRNYKSLADKLITFTMKKPDQSRFTKVSDILPSLAQLIKSKEFSRVLIPFQVFMRPVLPRGGKYVQPHNPFPVKLVYIADILEPVQVMTSLQKPKRITFRGTDGKSYGIMCKASDDLRKDAKVMEINNMVQWYMSGDKECRKRNLVVRMYTVTPLSDTCGIMEWIPNLHGYRPLITSLIKEVFQNTPRSVRHQFCDRKDSIAKKRQFFNDVMCPSHPLVMSYWFLKSFQDPQSWYMARTSYVKTAAVMSIVGFLMGLGDRHGENILLDSSNGDVVHVDFNCLFNKGETFDWPERVPFRLTRNMLNGMGPLKYEGMFRCCCEIVMRLLRYNSSVFLSIIRPFIFDPLLEWECHINSTVKTNQIGEVNNPKATDHLNSIRDRLMGSARNMTKERNVTLSVEAHVNYLIKEATKTDNLCQMYVGWGAYI
ncbi:unnamed protein product [Allacma fusca]|uniref:Serine/threonine-protein kinase ATR n=1 Tax=Allacma fusca TaxID=39272 RepID=A0A8J2L887_9HEXA|nr:unnamed protein product [Allacma fusca]